MGDPETTEEGGHMFGHELGAIIGDKSGWKAKRSEDILQLVDNGRGGCGEQRSQDWETRAIVNHGQEGATLYCDYIHSHLLPHSHNFRRQEFLRTVVATTPAHRASF